MSRAMFKVMLEIVFVSGVKIHPISNDQQVLSVGSFGVGSEIEATGHDGPAIDQHDLVMSDGVLGIDVGRDAMIGQEVGSRIGFRFLTFVEEHQHLYTSSMRVDAGMCDGFGRKRIGLNVNGSLSLL